MNTIYSYIYLIMLLMALFNRPGILSMSDVEYHDEKLFHWCFTLPGCSDGCTLSFVVQSCAFLALDPKKSLRTALTGTKSNIKQIFKQLFL